MQNLLHKLKPFLTCGLTPDTVSCVDVVKKKQKLQNRPGMYSLVLQVLSCRRLLQTQVENVFDYGCQEDVALLGTGCNGTTLHWAARHSAMHRYVAEYSPVQCDLQ